MKLVKCGKCGAQFDVAAMKPGSSFACGKCRSAVQVPGEAAPATVVLSPDQMKRALDEARGMSAPAPAAPAPAAAPKAQPKLPAAMQARAQAASASAPARAAGASAPPPAPAAAPASATQTKAAPRPARARPAGDAPTKQSPALTYGIIGGIVVIGGVAAFMLAGGSKPAETPTAQKPAEAPKPAEAEKPAPKAKDPSNVDDYLTLPSDEQNSSLVARLVQAGGDATQLQALLAWCKDAKLAGNAAAKAMLPRIVAKALEADPNCEWARTENGEKRLRDLLQGCKDECDLAFTMPDPAEKEINERLATTGDKPWADAAEWKKYDALVATVRARNKLMKDNPRYLLAEKKRDWVRQGNEFKGVEMTWTFADPYVIFQEVKKQDARDIDRNGQPVILPNGQPSMNPSKVAQNETWAKKGALFVKRDGIIFNELNRRFRELFADEFKFEPLETCGPDKKGRVLTALVMWNRRSFDNLLKEAGQQVSPFIRAFYSPPQQKIFHYLGDDSLQGGDEVPVEGGYVQKGSDQVTYHEGTHQLVHEYTAIFNGHPLTDGTITVNASRAMWFEEGIAEFMGAAEIEADKAEFLEGGKWRHNRILLERINESRRNRDNVEAWGIKDFIKAQSNEDLQTMGEKLRPGVGPNMASHFYCRAWAFCHFLWYYDNGKYRPKFMNFFREFMKSAWSAEKLAKDFGRPNVNDWGPVDKEFAWYWNKLLSRKVEKSKVTGRWSTPPTDPPTGKVEDDADFLEQWAEDHKNEKK
jgi:hypothetical protein